MLNKNFTYLPALKTLGNDLNAIFKAVHLSSFKSLILPADLFDWLDMQKNNNSSWSQFDLNNANFKILSVLDIIPEHFAAEVPMQNKTIIRNFINNFDSLLDQLVRLKINSCSLNLNLENAFKIHEKEIAAVELLKKISPYLIRKNISMLLPVRIPSVFSVDFEKYSFFHRNIMNPNMKLSIEIHPHEFRIKQNPLEVLKPFKYKIGMFSFIYEPEAGNYLVDKLLTPWLDALQELSYNGIIVFAPLTAKPEVFSRELTKLTDLIQQS